MSKPIPLVVRTISRTALGTAWRAYARDPDSDAGNAPLVGVVDRRNPRAVDPRRALLLLDMYNEVQDRIVEWVDERLLEMPVTAKEGPVRTAVTGEVLDLVHSDLGVMVDYFNDLAFPLPVYRGMVVSTRDVVRLQGASWTPNRAIAEGFAIGSHDACEATHAGFGGRCRSVLLQGTIRSSLDVDWRQTLSLFHGYSLEYLGDNRHAEEEIRIADGRVVHDVREIALEDA